MTAAKTADRERSPSSAAASGPSRAARSTHGCSERPGRRGRRAPDRGRVRASRAGRSSGPTEWFDALGATVTGLDGAQPARRRGRRQRRRGRATPSSSTSPTARRCTCVRCSRAARSTTRWSTRTRRRGDRRVGRGRDVLVRSDGRSTRRRVHRRARARAGPRGVPVPRHRRRPPPRALDRPACRATRCSSASTSRPRSSATASGRVGGRRARARVTVYRKGAKPKTFEEPGRLDRPRRATATTR